MPTGKPLSRGGFLKRGAFIPRRPVVTPEERKGRKALRARCNSVCEVDGRNPMTDTHHRRNRSQGGSWALSNLLGLCHACHMRITVNPAIAMEQGWTVRSNRDPASVPVWLAGRGYSFLNDDGSIEQVEDDEVA